MRTVSYRAWQSGFIKGLMVHSEQVIFYIIGKIKMSLAQAYPVLHYTVYTMRYPHVCVDGFICCGYIQGFS